MNPHRIIITTLLVAALGPPIVAVACPGVPGCPCAAGECPGGSGAQGAGPLHYDPASVETLEGTIASIARPAGHVPGVTGVHVDLETANGTVAVHLGPSWFLDRQGVRLEKGRAITVTGSRTTIGDAPAVVAREIVVGKKTVLLRDEAGRPQWGGGGRGPRRGRR